MEAIDCADRLPADWQAELAEVIDRVGEVVELPDWLPQFKRMIATMGTLQKRKGKAGEQELARALRELLGLEVTRNLLQARSGGSDLLGIEGWAVECKRAQRQRLSEWWAQTCEQAQSSGQRPVLCYRLDRQPWRVVLALRDVATGFENAPLSLSLEASLDVFAALVRESASVPKY